VRGNELPTTIYGIKNCDTMKKARAWLEKHGVDYAFHDNERRRHCAKSFGKRAASPKPSG
jgi:arsenate reductase-like glutaredoxin family protein